MLLPHALLYATATAVAALLCFGAIAQGRPLLLHRNQAFGAGQAFEERAHLPGVAAVPTLSHLGARRLAEMSHETGHEVRQLLVHVQAGSSLTGSSLADHVGATVHAYLPHDTFLVHGPLSAAAAAVEHSEVEWVAEMQPAWKLAPDLWVAERLEAREPGSQGRGLHASSTALTGLHVLLVPAALNGSAPEAVLGAALEARGVHQFELELASAFKVVLRVPAALEAHAAHAVAALSHVSWVEREPEVHALNKYARWVTQSAQSVDTPVWAAGLRGEGEVVGCADTGLDIDSCFFHDPDRAVAYHPSVNTAHRKIVTYVPFADSLDDVNGHGTHVLGSVLGDPTSAAPSSYADHVGMAPKAKVAFTDIGVKGAQSLSVPADLRSGLFQFPYSQAGARIHTNSWGTLSNHYLSFDHEVDSFVATNPDFLVLFAAGNAGVCGWHTSGSPANNKNGLAVGASRTATASIIEDCNNRPSGTVCVRSTSGWLDSRNDITSLAFFSSRGPTNDGRIKPDVVAPGHHIISARSDGLVGTPNCGTTVCSSYHSSCPSSAGVLSMSGTSMATPVTAGTAALVRQYFREGYYPTGAPVSANALLPSAALLKAVLITSAQPLTGWVDMRYGGVANTYAPLEPAPSMQQGHGRVQLNNVLYFSDPALGAQRRLWVRDTDQVATGQRMGYCFAYTGAGQVPAGSPIKVTLAWTDPAAQPYAAITLVNNLDLLVLDPADRWLLGNGPRSASNAGTDSTVAEAADDANNVESVTVQSPAANGPLVVLVAGAHVPLGPQRFALVVSGPALQYDATCTAQLASSPRCPGDCSGHGTCDTGVTPARCQCQAPYTGPACAATVCPRSCLGRGTCDAASGTCVCSSAFGGPWCQFQQAVLPPTGGTQTGPLASPYVRYVRIPLTPGTAKVVSLSLTKSTSAWLFLHYAVDSALNVATNTAYFTLTPSGTSLTQSLQVTASASFVTLALEGFAPSTGCNITFSLTTSVTEFQVCQPSSPLTTASGQLVSNVGAVTGFSCAWLLAPPGDVVSITFKWLAFQTHANDLVRIYQGSSASGQPTSQLSGTLLPQDVTIAGPRAFVTYAPNSAQNGFIVNYFARVRPEITMVEPRFVAAAGGTVLRVLGKHFNDWTAADLVCRFGGSVASAEFVSSTELRCTVPSAAAAGVSLRTSVGVSVSNEGSLFSNAVPAATLQWVPEPVVDGLLATPRVPPFPVGAVNLTGIFVQQDLQQGALECVFTAPGSGGAVRRTSAQFVSTSLATCPLPLAKDAAAHGGLQQPHGELALSVRAGLSMLNSAELGSITVEAEACPEHCSGNGLCVGTCHCRAGWEGAACDRLAPLDCGALEKWNRTEQHCQALPGAHQCPAGQFLDTHANECVFCERDDQQCIARDAVLAECEAARGAWAYTCTEAALGSACSRPGEAFDVRTGRCKPLCHGGSA